MPFDFEVDVSASSVVYSLDGQENLTASRNMVLKGLSEGAHTLTVYAWDKYGNVASETVTFAVAKEAFPTTLVLSAVVVAVVVCAGLLLYFFKFKKRRAA